LDICAADEKSAGHKHNKTTTANQTASITDRSDVTRTCRTTRSLVGLVEL